MTARIRLGVNIDHVATVRNARGGPHPDPVRAAQLAMDAYHAVEVKLIPSNGIPAIQSNSVVKLPDGRVQFTFTAGAGLATQATVWGTTSLTPPTWKLVARVPLTNGQGAFTDSTAPTGATRFYRVTLP